MRSSALRHLSLLLAFALVGAACTDDPETSADVDPEAQREAYCAVSAEIGVLADGFDPLNATATEIEGFYREQLSLLEEALAVTPGALVDAVEVQRRAAVDTIAILDSVGWDFEFAIDDLGDVYLADDYLGSETQLGAFDVEGCGFVPDETESGELPEVPVEAPPEVPAEYVDYCNASFEAAQSDDLALDADSDDTETYYRDLLIRLDQLFALAPAQLVDAITTIRENFAEVVVLYETVDWDLDRGLLLVEEWASDPAIGEGMNAAIGIVEAFDAEVCGISFF